MFRNELLRTVDLRVCIRSNLKVSELCPRHYVVTILSCTYLLDQCIAVKIVDIVDIDSISIRYRFVLVGSIVLLSISIRNRYDIVLFHVRSILLLSISSISIPYRFVIVGSDVLLSVPSTSIRYRYIITPLGNFFPYKVKTIL